MAKILYAWELGADYGHVNRFRLLAERLHARGHDVVFAVKDLSRIQVFPGIDKFEVVQAPVWLSPVTGLPEPQVCYPDILHRFGYLSFEGLLGMVKAWRALYALVGPQLLIADHAPTALLATRGLTFPRVMYGNGFFSPPRTSPLPSMRPWMQIPEQRLRDSERAALETVNRVLAKLGLGQLDCLAQMLAVEEDFLMTAQELDHYAQRGEAHYAGPLLSPDGGAPANWPAAAGPKVFVYAKPSHKQFDRLVKQLRASPFCVLVHAPGLSESQRLALQSPQLHLSSQPLDMGAVCQEAVAVVCHAGSGTVARALCAGLPLLLLPMHLEQTLTARNAVHLGAGMAVGPLDEKLEFVALLRELLDNPTYTERARDFARKYAQLDQEAVLDSIAARCEELMTHHRSASTAAGVPARA